MRRDGKEEQGMKALDHTLIDLSGKVLKDEDSSNK
jgi:hypothetical protein